MKVSFYTLRDCQRSIEDLSNNCYFSDIVKQELCNECYWSGDGLCDSTLLTSSSLGFRSVINLLLLQWLDVLFSLKGKPITAIPFFLIFV